MLLRGDLLYLPRGHWHEAETEEGQISCHLTIGPQSFTYPKAGLSDITLRWMIAKAEACGLTIDQNCMTTINNPKPDPFGTLYNSQTPWYKIAGLGDYIRPIGQKANESAASSALVRLNNPQSNYEPSNLKDFLARQGQVTRVP